MFDIEDYKQQELKHRSQQMLTGNYECAAFLRDTRVHVRRQAQRIQELESQLAAQAAAVEVMKTAAKKVMPLAQQTIAAKAGAEWMQTTEESGGPYPSDELIQMRADMAALAALVAAAGKEDE